MDNREIDISTEGRNDFEMCMRLAANKNRKTLGYRIIDSNNIMVLYWSESKRDGFVKFPYEMNIDDVINFVWGWLEKVDPKSSKPDHDGDNEKGFRVFNGAWGHVDHEWQAYIAVMPIWAMYGK